MPPFACSILPSVVLTAPVKAPFSCPNSSLSSRFSGIAAQLMATKLPFRAIARLVQPAGEQFLAGPARAQQHDRNVGVRDPLDRAGDTDHLGRRGDQPAEHAIALARLVRKRPVLRLDPVQVERAPHDQAELLDIDRLLVEVVGARAAIAWSALSRAPWPVATITLVSGLSAHDLVEHGEAFARAVGIGRQAEVERHDGGLFGTQRGDCAGAISGDR